MRGTPGVRPEWHLRMRSKERTSRYHCSAELNDSDAICSTGSPQEVEKLIREGMERWGKLIQELNLQLN